MRVLVFAGGDPPPPGTLEDLARAPAGEGTAMMVVAADSGAVHAVAAGFDVDVLVGDLDSIPPALLSRLEQAGTRVDRHPAAKDKTDLAIALDLAASLEPAAVTVVGGAGGRLDHLLANALLLAADDYAHVRLDARIGSGVVTVVRGLRPIRGRAGDVVSLLAVGGPARGVTTHGLLFPLRDATLEPGSSWGVSNELRLTHAAVEVASGVVLAVQPGVRGVLTAGEAGEAADPIAPP